MATGGGKTIRVLPKLLRFDVDINGMTYPGSEIYRQMSKNPHIVYEMYCKHCVLYNEIPVSYYDFIYRYACLRIRYDSSRELFGNQVVGVQGVDTQLTQVHINYEFAHALTGDHQLKMYVHHVVPNSIVMSGTDNSIKVLQ